MLKLGDKNITKLYYGDKAISKVYYGDKLVFQAGGRFVESIIFDGNSYIDTGIIPTENTGAYINLTQTESTDCVILGCRTDNNDTRLFLCAKAFNCINIGRNTYKYLNSDGSFTNLQTSKSLNTSYNLPSEIWSNYLNSRILRAKYEKTDVTSVELETLTFTPTLTMYLGCQNKANAPLNYYKGDISQCVITKGEKIIQDLRPYVDADGVACFKDIVTGELFYNQGTGTLGYAEE